MPNAGAIFVLTLLAGLSEGVGLAVFVPLISLLTGDEAVLGPPFSMISQVIGSLGFVASPAILLGIIVSTLLASFTLRSV